MTHHIEITHMETNIDGSGLVAVISVVGKEPRWSYGGEFTYYEL